ncbi:MAG: S8 family serine peptidase, partial [candidate division WOR-3 bacterium]
MTRGAVVFVLCAIVLIHFSYSQEGGTAEKRISSVDDLPRRSYEVSGSVSELMKDDRAFSAFAAKVRADIESDLEGYDIEDRTTLRNFYSVLKNLDVLEGKYENALKTIERIRELQDKEAQRYTTGIVSGSVITWHIRVGDVDREGSEEVLSDLLSAALEKLPWNIVQESVEEIKGSLEILSENLIMSIVAGQFDPVVEQTGEVSNEIAYRIINLRYAMTVTLPIKETIVSTLARHIAANRIEKPDIWQERHVELDASDGFTPVVVGIWDTGLDVDVFRNVLFVNEKEIADGVDNDSNGFVDDIHGIAYDLEEEKTSEILYPVELTEKELKKKTILIKGFFDVQSAIDSDEASLLRQEMSKMRPEDFNAFFEELMMLALHMHGTHVAGIAVDGNPYARILTVRFTTDYHTIPKEPTIELSHKMARNYAEAIEYMKANGVRVVNMSWGGTVRGTESDLEANGVGETAEERARLAREMFDIEKEALFTAMREAPGILFVNAAGNDNDNVSFEDYYPASFDLPNLLVVGAVDKAGDVTS